MTPTDSASFASFREALVKKLRKYENSPHFVAFLDSLVKNLCLQIDVEVVRRISVALAASETEKRREAKKAKKGGKTGGGAASSAAPASKSKSVAANRRDVDAFDLAGDVAGMAVSIRKGDYDDMDDFM